MKRDLQPEEIKLWAVVAATVRPATGRVPTRPPKPEPPSPVEIAGGPGATPVTSSAALAAHIRPVQAQPAQTRPALTQSVPTGPEVIEPTRRRRIAKGRESIQARLDLHGLDQVRARTRLLDFLLGAQARGARAVLVITGKGHAGEGVLRRRTPEWLSHPELRSVIAGLSPAETHHGGDGAFYIALKRPRR